MAETTIEWADFTFNPWRGCMKVSDGCKNCYAETLSKRNPKTLGEWGPNGVRAMAAESYWQKPLKWNREAEDAGERRRVFCASLADVFEDRPELIKPRTRLMETIHQTPFLDWLLLTKRPENILPRLRECYMTSQTETIDWLDKWLVGDVPENVWLGTSVENQQTAHERIPHLLQVPAKVRFLSCEPLLDEVNLFAVDNALDFAEGQSWLNSLRGYAWQQYGSGDVDTCSIPAKIDWVIVGGESGPNARPVGIGCIREIAEQCRAANVPVFVKQLGAKVLLSHAEAVRMEQRDMSIRIYQSTPGLWRWEPHDRKGGNMDEWPMDLQVREMPEVAR